MDTFLGSIDPKANVAIVNFSMEKARESAWSLATTLAPLNQNQWKLHLDVRDLEATALAELVRHPIGLIFKLGLIVIRSRESNDVARINYIGEPPSIWDLESNSRIAVPIAEAVKVNDLEWSPDGVTLALACTEGTIQLFEPSGKRRIIKAASVEVRDLSWSPDGRMLGSCPTDSSDRTIGLWDPQTLASVQSPWAKERVVTTALSAKQLNSVTFETPGRQGPPRPSSD